MKKSSLKQKKQTPHWAMETCSNVQMLLTIPMLIVLVMIMILSTILLIVRLTQSSQNQEEKASLGTILSILIFSSLLFFGTIWVYRRHPSWLCYLLLTNLVMTIYASLAR